MPERIKIICSDNISHHESFLLSFVKLKIVHLQLKHFIKNHQPTFYFHKYFYKRSKVEIYILSKCSNLIQLLFYMIIVSRCLRSQTKVNILCFYCTFK